MRSRRLRARVGLAVAGAVDVEWCQLLVRGGCLNENLTTRRYRLDYLKS
jgi:hypothetical protein